MTEYSFFEKQNKKSVIALGFFDAVHVGHVAVLSACVELSRELNACPTAFTFLTNPSEYFGGEGREICSYNERILRLQNLGIENVVYAPCETKFFDIEPQSFLDKLINDFNIVGICCGFDYTFGVKGTGKVDYLQKYCVEKGIALKVVNELQIDGDKIGSSRIKGLLESGNIPKASQLLGYNYTLSGQVQRGRGDGKKLVVPTLNIPFPHGKAILKRGVYVTKTEIDGQKYLGITNVGEHPTFGDYNYNVETYLLDFKEEIYGQNIKVEFIEYIREITTFESVDKLKEQILKDVEFARRTV